MSPGSRTSSRLSDEIEKNEEQDDDEKNEKVEKKEKTPEYTGEAVVTEVKPLAKERSVKEGDIPQELGSDFTYFVEPEYVRARYHPEDDSFLVIDANKVAKFVPAVEFNAQYTPIPPNKIKTKFQWGAGGVEEVPPPPPEEVPPP